MENDKTIWSKISNVYTEDGTSYLKGTFQQLVKAIKAGAEIQEMVLRKGEVGFMLSFGKTADIDPETPVEVNSEPLVTPYQVFTEETKSNVGNHGRTRLQETKQEQ